MSRVRSNISLSEPIMQRAREIMAARAFDEFSDLLAALISRNAQPRNPEVSRDHWNDEWSA